MSLHFVLVVVGVAALVFLGLWVVLTRFYRAVDQGQALVVNKMNQAPEVAFTGALVLPVVHRAEVMDLSLKSVTLERRGGDGVLCADGVRADVDVTFLLRVNNTVRDVLEVAQTIGCARASDPERLQELFGARFSEALEFFCSEVEFERLHAHRGTFVAGLID
ncbi:MAG TPA: SPFH domain-containing protein [Myxococcota bacterium]|nr:SPFH domain-containing protein [Myxococcota bacterium]